MSNHHLTQLQNSSHGQIDEPGFTQALPKPHKNASRTKNAELKYPFQFSCKTPQNSSTPF
jgi:hypothetical protein